MTNNYYQRHKERVQEEEARENYQNLSEEEQDKRWKKARERYQDFTKEEKENNTSVSLWMK